MIKTHDLRMVRGETLTLTLTIKDETGTTVDLTGGTAHLRVRPDPKAATVVSKTNGSGITLATQTGATKGQLVAVLSPADTSSLPVGDYVWDAWFVTAAGARHAVVAPSRLTIIQEVTTLS